MPLLFFLFFFHPSVHQLVLKAEGIRSNPNFSLLTTRADVPRLVKSGQLGGGWGLAVCRSWLFRSVDPIRRVVTRSSRATSQLSAGQEAGRLCATVSSGHTQLASLEELVR